MTKHVLLIPALAVLLMSGCATNGKKTPVFVDDPSIGNDCPDGPVYPREIAVSVYEESGTVYVIPERIVVQHPSQRVVWTATNGEIANIAFGQSSCAGQGTPPPINERARQHRRSFGKGYRGAHKYGFWFYPDTNQDPIEVDPMIIIEY